MSGMNSLITLSFLLHLSRLSRSSSIPNDTMEALQNTVTCGNTQGNDNPDVGPMRPDKEIYCNGCQRDTICCGPEDPVDIVSFKLYLTKYVRASPSQPPLEMRWDSIADCQLLVLCNRVVYVVHGYTETFESSAPFYDGIRDGWLAKDSCVIMVDWSKGNKRNYFQAIANVRSVGAAIGFNIWQCLAASIEKSLIVGHSLGGQIVGEAGKFFSRMSQLKGGQVKVPLCHALDPAGPFYDDCSKKVRLDKGDCQEVHVCHSDSQANSQTPAGVSGYGSNIKCGHCDFWVNCGFEQRKPCPGMTTYQYFSGTEVNGPGFVEDFTSHEMHYDHKLCSTVYISQLDVACFHGVPCPGCPDRKCPPPKEYFAQPTVPLMVDHKCTQDSDYFVNTNSSNSDRCINTTP